MERTKVERKKDREDLLVALSPVLAAGLMTVVTVILARLGL